MTELPVSFRPLDPGRINSMDPTELAWWCRELGCSLAELDSAIERAGEHVSAVRDALHDRPAPQR